jgi:hypothetical protein
MVARLAGGRTRCPVVMRMDVDTSTRALRAAERTRCGTEPDPRRRYIHTAKRMDGRTGYWRNGRTLLVRTLLCSYPGMHASTFGTKSRLLRSLRQFAGSTRRFTSTNTTDSAIPESPISTPSPPSLGAYSWKSSPHSHQSECGRSTGPFIGRSESDFRVQSNNAGRAQCLSLR